MNSFSQGDCMPSSLKTVKKTQQSTQEIKTYISNVIYMKEYLYFLLLGIMFCIFLSLLTFDPGDPSGFSINASSSLSKVEVENLMGKAGAIVSDWMYQLFGIGALLFSFIFIGQILGSLQKPEPKSRFYLKLFGYPQLIIFFLGLSCRVVDSLDFRGIEIYSGGYLGHIVSEFFYSIFGKTGSILALAIGTLSSLILCLGLRPTQIFPFMAKLTNFKSLDIFLKKIKALNLKSLKKVFISLRLKRKRSQLMHSTRDVSKAQSLKKNSLYQAPREQKDIFQLFNTPDFNADDLDTQKTEKMLFDEARAIEEKLLTFSVKGQVVKSFSGPIVNIHEFEPASGVKVSKVISYQDDLALALKTKSLLIDMQYGKSTLAIEVPKKQREHVYLQDLVKSDAFKNPNLELPIALGKSISGEPLVSDLTHMPHLLVAGATGSGKSVCINSMILSLTLFKSPEDLKLILVDPKVLELSSYNELGHLLTPVVTEAQKATGVLEWAISEMERRYIVMKKYEVRNIKSYNRLIEKKAHKSSGTYDSKKMPYIVIIIDELCDLMMTTAKRVEDSIQRLAQKSRAAGIHLVLATQRPSVDVITGVIKANLPSRISFQVASRHDSRTIIESIGAERLLGKGDMLYMPSGENRFIRAQCAYVSDEEIGRITKYLKDKMPVNYDKNIESFINTQIEKAALFDKNKTVKENFHPL